jgi:hypothetical protein
MTATPTAGSAVGAAAIPCTDLGTDERIAGRAFCDPSHTSRDRATLTRLREAVKRQADNGRRSVLQFADEIGEHFVAVPDWDALARPQPVAVIGFFGQSRERVDHAPIVEIEHEIVARAAAFPGLLAYHNAQLGEGHWGNMVVLVSRAAVANLAPDPMHVRAVASAPSHYESLRLHRGSLAEGLLGSAGVVLDETLYLDFSSRPAWRGLRVYARSAQPTA